MVQVHPDPPVFTGAVAQLGEHLLCKQGVVGSIPISSTNGSQRSAGRRRRARAGDARGAFGGLTSALWGGAE